MKKPAAPIGPQRSLPRGGGDFPPRRWMRASHSHRICRIAVVTKRLIEPLRAGGMENRDHLSSAVLTRDSLSCSRHGSSVRWSMRCPFELRLAPRAGASRRSQAFLRHASGNRPSWSWLRIFCPSPAGNPGFRSVRSPSRRFSGGQDWVTLSESVPLTASRRHAAAFGSLESGGLRG